MQSKFYNYINIVIQAMNKIDSRLFIFLILCLNLLSFLPYSNEEAYFSLAKQYADPSWIPGSFTFTEWVGTRFLFQNIAGFALNFMSFEQLAFWGRMVNFLLYAFPLALIFKRLKISNLGILVVMMLFIQNVDTQHFFGKEWIFLGFESKTLAYVFVLWGYYGLLTEKYRMSALHAAFASYFHILVGGWFFVLVFIFVFFRKLNIKLSFQVGIIYVLAVLPFMAYLATNLVESGSVIHGVDIDWVYSFFRNTHHTAPMHTPGAMQKILPRVVVSFGLLLLSIFYFRKQEDERIRILNRIALISLCMVFAGLILTYVDVHGRILKYYVFRIASIGAFSYYLMLLLFLGSKLEGYRNRGLVRCWIFIAAALFFLLKAGKNVDRMIHARIDRDLVEMTAFVNGHSDPDDVFMFLENDELAFSRLARRESLVIFKFDPGGGEKIYEWYIREKMRRQLQSDITCLDTICNTYRLDYLIARTPINYKGLNEVFHNKKYYLYKVIHENECK